MTTTEYLIKGIEGKEEPNFKKGKEYVAESKALAYAELGRISREWMEILDRARKKEKKIQSEVDKSQE